MYSWMEISGQWKQGIIYPRWAALEHWGYGEARFLFYPPASWVLGGALGTVLPWHIAPGAYIWIALTLAAGSMFLLAREWFPVRDALFAAALYGLNPYHLVIVYWRSAFAELLAAALLPLLLLCSLRLQKKDTRPVLWLAVILAASWLTNAPAAVMVHYSLAAMAALSALLGRSWRPMLKAAAAILLGAALASFYLLPAIYEQKWVNIAEVLAPGVRPIDNFLFTTTADPDHNRFNLLVSIVAAAEIVAVGLAIWWSREWLSKHPSGWTLLSAWAAVSAVVMFRFTNIFWEHLPKLRFVQLPWRWLLCMNVALAVLLTVAAKRWVTRTLVVSAMLFVVAGAGYFEQTPWWDHSSDIQEMATAMSNGTGNEGTDEYVPAGADPYELNREEPRVIRCGPAAPSDCRCALHDAVNECKPAQAKILSWGAADKHFVVHASQPQNVGLRLFNYPAWRVTVNGKSMPSQTTDVTGQIVIPLGIGTSDVHVRFVRTPDRTFGGIISLVSLAGLSVAGWNMRKAQRAEPA